MTIDNVERVRKLSKDLMANFDKQHKLIMEMADILAEYNAYIVSEMQRLRDLPND